MGIISVGAQEPWAWVTGIWLGILIATPFILVAAISRRLLLRTILAYSAGVGRGTRPGREALAEGVAP